MTQSWESFAGRLFGRENFVLRILAMGSWDHSSQERPSTDIHDVKHMVCTDRGKLQAGKAIKYSLQCTATNATQGSVSVSVLRLTALR
jgi:hypothetical protein